MIYVVEVIFDLHVVVNNVVYSTTMGRGQSQER